MSTLNPSQIATLSALETADQFVVPPGSFCATPFGGWNAHRPLSTEDKGVCARLLFTNKGTFSDCEVRNDKCLRKGTVETPVGYQSLAQALTHPVVTPPVTEQGSEPPAGGAQDSEPPAGGAQDSEPPAGGAQGSEPPGGGAQADLLERLRSIDTTPQVQAGDYVCQWEPPTPGLGLPS